MSNTPQFRLRTLFVLIVVASVVSLIWRWDRKAQDAWLEDAARHETLQKAAAAAEQARIEAEGRLLVEKLGGLPPVTNVIVVEKSMSDTQRKPPYDQTLLNDLPPRKGQQVFP